jgi:hypothetical protein
MPSRRRRATAPRSLAQLSVLICVMGLLMFLAAAAAAGTLARALASIRIRIEGFDDREGAPIIVECVKAGIRSLDGRYTFSAQAEADVLKSRKWSGTPFTDFLSSLSRGSGREYVLFLVRPDGTDTFKRFRDILVLRNDSVCTVSAAVPGEGRLSLDGLGKELRRKIEFRQGKLSFGGPMRPEERDSLAGAVGHDRAFQLFDLAAHSDPCVDHGVELIPAEWKLIKDATGQLQIVQGAR